MVIGARISPDWLDRPDDLKFLKQVGVDCVDVEFDFFPEFKEAQGRLNREDVERVVETLDRIGLKIEKTDAKTRYSNTIYLDRPEAEREIENLIYNIELCGEFKLPLMEIPYFLGSPFETGGDFVHDWVEGRGGYRHLKVDLSDALNRPPPAGAPAHEEMWDYTLNAYRQVMPAAERAGVKFALHGNDPPVLSLGGTPQILVNYAAFDRLFSEVPSPNNGMLFCVGTRHESGEDVFEGIKRFGEQGRIFHVHFRNVRGTIPETGGYTEVIPDEGDLDMYQVTRALHEVGFEGAIDFDHKMRLTGDGPEGREYVAFCVGHMRGILQALESEHKIV